MHLIYEEYDIALALYLVYETLNAALELSAELCSRNKSGKVEKVYLLIRKIERNVSIVYTLSDTLSNGSFTYTGFTDEAGVILCTARKDLDYTRNFFISADYTVELTVSGFL